MKIPEIPDHSDRTSQSYVYARLRHAIMIGAIAPGTQLTIRGLAEAMALSQTPIREAVRRLSSEHAIEITATRRMAVPKMTAGRFKELAALRSTLEAHAGLRALPYISNVQIDEMVDIDDQMDQSVAQNDFTRLTILNQEFHRKLYSANPDPVSIPLIESLWLQIGPFQRQAIEKLSEFYHIDRHKEILAALRSRDQETLSQAIERDILDGMSRKLEQLIRSGDQDADL